MPLLGKGFMIVNILDCEGGNPNTIANLAQSAGLKHVAVKIADGPWRWNFLRSGQDLVPELINALHARDIQVLGWHFLYGRQPAVEAEIAVKRVHELPGLDGYIIDAGSQLLGQDQIVEDFTTHLYNGLPDFPIALSSFRSPQAHLNFPWNKFLQICNWNMPQIYWIGSSNPGEQVRRCVAQFNQMTPNCPIVPVGAAFEEIYTERGQRRLFKPTHAEITDFLSTAVNLRLPGATFFSWDWCRSRLPEIWQAIADFEWKEVFKPVDIRDQLIETLNAKDTRSLVHLYKPDAFHITQEGPVYGINQILKRFDTLLNHQSGSSFRIVKHKGCGEVVHFTWEAYSPQKTIWKANDSLCLVDGKIICHYSQVMAAA